MEKNTLFRVKISFLLAVLLVALILPATVEAQGRVHVVRYGDTLYSIARRYGTSVEAIMRTNGLSNRNFIWVGQRLTIPGSGSSGGSSYSSGGYGGGGSYSSGGGGGYSSGPRQMYPATCSECGRDTEVPFQPRSDKPVYCRECFQLRRSAAPPRNYNY